MFTKLYMQLFKEGCKPTQATVLSMIFDRMNSSRQRINFYSNTRKDYFVIYSCEELAQELNVSSRTISRILQKSIDEGFIEIKLIHNRVNLIFMTNKSKKLVGQNVGVQETSNNQALEAQPVQSETTTMTNCPANQTKYNKQTNKSNTHVTSENAQETQSLTMDSLETTIVEKTGIPKKATHILKSLSFNDPNMLYHYVSLILRAKAHVIKHAPGNTTYSLIFDKNNHDLADDFNNHIFSIVMNANKKARNRDKYMMGALIEFFKMHYNAYEYALN